MTPSPPDLRRARDEPRDERRSEEHERRELAGARRVGIGRVGEFTSHAPHYRRDRQIGCTRTIPESREIRTRLSTGTTGMWEASDVALDRVRATARRPEYPTDVALADLLVDDVDTAELASLHDDAARVLVALRAVPPEQREALVAVTLQGMSAREYSGVSQLPLGTVKTRIRLALRKLRDELGAFAT